MKPAKTCLAACLAIFATLSPATGMLISGIKARDDGRVLKDYLLLDLPGSENLSLRHAARTAVQGRFIAPASSRK